MLTRSVAALFGTTLLATTFLVTDPAAPAAVAHPVVHTSQEQQAPVDDNLITWGITPAPEMTDDGPEERVSFRLELEPGQTITEEVAVTNYSPHDVVFELNTSEGTINDDGHFELLPAGETPTGAGAWIEIDAEVSVPAGETVVVPFNLAVPQDAVPGDHPGGITAGIASADSAETLSLNAVVGARIHLRVAGELAPQVSLENVSAHYTPSWNPFAPGVLSVEWEAANTGNIRLGSEQFLTVEGLFGLNPGVSDQSVAVQREVLPGQSAQASVEVQAWPFGPLTTQLVAEQNVVGDDDVDVELSHATATTTVWAIPWVYLVILAVLILGVVSVVVSRRRQKRAIAQALETGRAQAVKEAEVSAQAEEPVSTDAP